MSELTKTQVERMLKKYSGMRVSAEATEELIDVLEEVAMTVGSTATDLAATARRKTVTIDDVKLAVKHTI